jgi:hypothetical protein
MWYRAWEVFGDDELITEADDEGQAIYLLLNDGREEAQMTFILAEEVYPEHPLWEDWMTQE